MKRTLTILILAHCIYLVKAQENQKNQFDKHDVLIKISPLSLLNPNFPCIETGASFFLESNLAIQLKVGHKLDVFNWDDPHKTSGTRIMAEYQYCIGRRMYLAIENGYLINNFSDDMVYFESEDSDTEIIDEFTAQSRIIFGMAKTGIALFISDRWVVDFYGGVGFKYHRRIPQDLEFDESLGHLDPTFYEWGIGPRYTELDDFFPRITLGLNINFKF